MWRFMELHFMGKAQSYPFNSETKYESLMFTFLVQAFTF